MHRTYHRNGTLVLSFLLLLLMSILNMAFKADSYSAEKKNIEEKIIPRPYHE